MITDTKDPQIVGNQPRMYEKTRVATDLVINHGVDPKTAMIFATNGKVPAVKTVEGFKAKLRKYSLTAPSMVKKARNIIRDAMDFKAVEIEQQAFDRKKGEVVTYTEKIIPSYTNALTAAFSVADRDQPIRNVNVNLNVNTNIDPVDMDKYAG